MLLILFNPAGAAVPGIPADPSSLTATVVAQDIILGWQRNSTDEDGFNVERSDDGVSFAVIATVGAGVLTYTDLLPTPGVTYYYRVDAFNGFGTSGYSNVASATVPVPAPPQPPSGGMGITGNLVELVLGKNLKRGEPYKHKTKIAFRLQITTKITILGAAEEKPRVIRRRRMQRQVVCPLPIEVLMEIDEDLAIAEMARRSRHASI